jgi:DNA-binding transcriptional regulator YdaS (Cro superfamily)
MNEEMQQIIALRKLSKHFNYNRKELAEALNVSLQVVYLWFNRGRISKFGAVRAEKATNGAVTKQELRPDISEFKE